MSLGRIPIPDHPARRPCPFCGREARVAPCRATPISPAEYSVRRWEEPDPFSHASHWDDCLGPTMLWLPLERAVEQWNTRRREQ